MKKYLPLLILLVSFTATAQVSEKKISKYAKTITEKELKAKLSIIASAEMEGRETATPGQKKAAAYIESKFREFGLLPGNGNSYQMLFDVFQDSLEATTFSIGAKEFTLNKDYTFSVSSMPMKFWDIDSIVFVGNGFATNSRNDYEGADVKNRWVLVYEGSGGFFGLRTKIATAKAKGAKGVLLVSKNFPRAIPVSVKGSMYTKKGEEFPTVTISYNVISALLDKNITDSASLFSLNKEMMKTIHNALGVFKKQLKLQSSNVLGILPGTDKKDEYVFVTAHYDHLGIRNGVIYYGADDDGSGTTTVLQLAEAFAKAKKKGDGPRRTMVFMTVSGEEEGLLGSEYYAEHPIFPLDKTSVDLNIDMVGRIDPKYKGDSMNYVYVIGEDKLSSDLMPITDSINRTYMNNMELDRKYNDITDPNRFYYRSDHYNFAKHGVPIIFYFDGVHADYHRPTDTVDKINFDLMQKRAQLIFYTAWEMANRERMLKRDIPLNVPSR